MRSDLATLSLNLTTLNNTFYPIKLPKLWFSYGELSIRNKMSKGTLYFMRTPIPNISGAQKKKVYIMAFATWAITSKSEKTIPRYYVVKKFLKYYWCICFTFGMPWEELAWGFHNYCTVCVKGGGLFAFQQNPVNKTSCRCLVFEFRSDRFVTSTIIEIYEICIIDFSCCRII